MIFQKSLLTDAACLNVIAAYLVDRIHTHPRILAHTMSSVSSSGYECPFLQRELSAMHNMSLGHSHHLWALYTAKQQECLALWSGTMVGVL